MKAGRFFIACVDNWVIPVASFGPVLFVFVVCGLIRNEIVGVIGVSVLATGIIWLICSAFYQFFKRKWFRGFATIGILLSGTVFASVVYFILSNMITMIDGDHWADNLTIPTNISLHVPIDFPQGRFEEANRDHPRVNSDFEIYKSFQPGIYRFWFWIGAIDQGSVYLKAFEITQNHQLSEERLRKQTLLPVFNSIDSLQCFKSVSDFKIYEGDWGKPYAARFEVWFVPDDGSSERKLITKNYKIEGWQH